MSRLSRQARQAQRGIALVFVLWAGALVAAIVVGVSLTTGAQLAAGAGTVDRLQAELLADAGIRAGIAEVLDGSRRREGQAPRRLEFELGGGRVTVQIASEYGRVDLNTASEPIVRGLADLVAGGDGDALAEAWLARRAGHEVPAAPLPPAGDGRPADADAVSTGTFIVQRELLDLPGVDRAVYARLRAATTVHARQPGIDPLAAPRDVLLSLPGADAEVVDEFIAQREAARGSGNERADQAYLLARLRARLPQAQALLVLRRPAVFSVSAVARTANGAERARVATVSLRRTPERPYSVLEWADDAWREDAAEAAPGDASGAG